MLKRRYGPACVVPILILSVAGLTGCSTSGDAAGGGLSLVDKAKTAKVCVDVAGSAQGAADVGTKVAQGTITQAEAAAQLEPIGSPAFCSARDATSAAIGSSCAAIGQ